MVVKVRERLTVRKQTTQKLDRERLDLRMLNVVGIEISNRFAALENVSDGEDIKKGWRNIKEAIKTSAKESVSLYELKQHKLWFAEECLGVLDQRKQAKM